MGLGDRHDVKASLFGYDGQFSANRSIDFNRRTGAGYQEP
jgi:hypothetical protein